MYVQCLTRLPWLIASELELVERFDHSFGASDRITVRGTWNNFAVQSVYDPTNLVSLAGGCEITSQNYIVHETHIFRPNPLNDVSITYWRLKSSRGPAPGAPNVADFGVQNIFQTLPKSIDSVSVAGFFGCSENPVAAFVRQGNAFRMI